MDVVSTSISTVTPLVKVHEQGPTFAALLISLPPSSAQFDFDHLSIRYKSQKSEQWTSMEVVTSLSEVVYVRNLLPEKNYTVKVIANYREEQISSEDLQIEMPTGGQLLFFYIYFVACKGSM